MAAMIEEVSEPTIAMFPSGDGRSLSCNRDLPEDIFDEICRIY
jgi:hypothetical protein